MIWGGGGVACYLFPCLLFSYLQLYVSCNEFILAYWSMNTLKQPAYDEKYKINKLNESVYSWRAKLGTYRIAAQSIGRTTGRLSRVEE